MKTSLLLASLAFNIYLSYKLNLKTTIPVTVYEIKTEEKQVDGNTVEVETRTKVDETELIEVAPEDVPPTLDPNDPAVRNFLDNTAEESQPEIFPQDATEQTHYFNGCIAGLLHTQGEIEAQYHTETCNQVRDNFFKKDENGQNQEAQH